MEINKLIEIVKEKISKEIILQEINVEDKSFLHKDHKNNSPNKFHIKISIISDELKPKKKIDSTKRVYIILFNFIPKAFFKNCIFIQNYFCSRF